MFIVSNNGQDRLEIEITGKVDSDEMKQGLNRLITESQQIEHGMMCFRIYDLAFPTIGAIAVEISLIPSLLKCIKQYKKAAVLSDKKWIRKISELEGALYPNLEIKAFELNEIEKAETWLEHQG